MNPYLPFVSGFTRLLEEGKTHPLGGFPQASSEVLVSNARVAMIFSPHPDDECIIGALPLRLTRQAQISVLNVAITLGSKQERRSARLDELRHACEYLGFGLIEVTSGGLDNININARKTEQRRWKNSVEAIVELLRQYKPEAIFFPHALDWNSTHIGTHFLVLDALRRLAHDFETIVVETEFWGQMQTPNLMIESSAADVADMVAGLSFHVGEVRRNPYHLRLPAWMMDNVRRGTELVGGQGAPAPNFLFATLYRMQHWKNSRFEAALGKNKLLPVSENPADLFV